MAFYIVKYLLCKQWFAFNDSSDNAQKTLPKH